MRESLLQGQPLLVKIVTRAPQVQRHLPAGFFFPAENLEDLIQAPPMM